MALCWSCKVVEYHDYNDKHGIRCPRCGQKEMDDPKRVVAKLDNPVRDVGGMVIGDDAVIKTTPAKRATRTPRSKR